MPTQVFGGSLAALLSVAVGVSSMAIQHIHGRIVAIHTKRGTFQIHHDPFPAMPMAMTMEAQPKRAADLAKLHVGEVIDATIDTTVVPWPAWNIRPAAPATRRR
jgi:Cu/Ag efflux protein CusF